jgi:hypothetical protein
MNPIDPKRGILASLALAIMLVVGGAGPAQAASQTIRNDQFWKDASGTALYSQGGGVFKFGSTWYWYGVHYAGAEAYFTSPSGKNSDTRFVSVTCYSSTDLVNWKFEGNSLDSNSTGLSGTGWFGRLGVAYNKTSKKYVLLAQHSGTSGNGVLFATSSTPNGKFAFDHIQDTLPGVVNVTSGDQTVFVDDDGKAYLVFSSASGRAHLYVAPLRSSDFLAVDQATEIYKGAGREGNCMFKYRGRYYFCSSDLHGWNASHTYVISATSITGTYSSETVMGNTDMDFSHVSQTGFFFRVDGTKDTTVVFAGDRWSDFAGNGLGYNQWMPLSFSGTAPSMNSVSEWTLDAATGSWAVGDGNNWALNPSFEADRVSQAALAGWTDSTDQSAFPGGNVSGGRTGRWALNLSDSVAYKAKVSQAVAGLPKASYTLSAWVRSSGGQKTANLYARTSAGKEYAVSASTAISSWKQLSVTGISVTDGKLEVGVRSDANAGNWVRVDDIALVKDATSTGLGADSNPVVPVRWEPTARSVRVAIAGAGELSLLDVEGRLLRRTTGIGEIELGLDGIGGLVIARVRSIDGRFGESKLLHGARIP